MAISKAHVQCHSVGKDDSMTTAVGQLSCEVCSHKALWLGSVVGV